MPKIAPAYSFQRRVVADRTGWPDVRCGLIEDAAAVTVAGVAAR